MADKEDVRVGDVVAVQAVDWGIYTQPCHMDDDFQLVTGRCYGQVIDQSEDRLVLSPQVFMDGGVRFVLVLPWVTVKRIDILERMKDGADI